MSEVAASLSFAEETSVEVPRAIEAQPFLSSLKTESASSFESADSAAKIPARLLDLGAPLPKKSDLTTRPLQRGRNLPAHG